MLKIPYQKDLFLPNAPLGKMNIYPWDDCGYTPEGTFSLVYNEKALRVRLTSPVGQPTVLTNQDNGPVWEDNCLEFFLAPYGDHPDYLNIECNALGAMILGKGPARAPRTSVLEILKPQMEVYTIVRPGKGFEVNYTIPLSALAELFDRPLLQKGDTLRMNLYICGEKTPQMHFGMWNKIDTPTPDFHRPEFFAKGVLE